MCQRPWSSVSNEDLTTIALSNAGAYILVINTDSIALRIIETGTFEALLVNCSLCILFGSNSVAFEDAIDERILTNNLSGDELFVPTMCEQQYETIKDLANSWKAEEKLSVLVLGQVPSGLAEMIDWQS
ncbi:hypothetical protein [Cognatiyoonia sp. IB215182]|uniref:hypothetical protein n=1 Tax=Cognatiyoonia sp. IB215182 TaxID=3097353 RepID=UPI002A14240A|nr:hypothetical protein [Cognatiyoonia sp. IB215182]MDX8355866.1 hypothetical protein [Cognatiyoonia sp. IB215182]